MKRKSLLIIFLTVFIDLIGFGIVLPLLPIYSEHHGASDLMIGLIIASFSAMQFLFAPAWGKLSDRIGRRPVLLISNLGSVVSYALFGYASTLEGAGALWMLLGSRVFAGVCGANLSVASAYIADVSPPEKRSKSMGLIGMAFGLGFILGPVLGALSVKIGPAWPGWLASAICLLNFLLTLAFLGESRVPGSQRPSQTPRVTQFLATLRQPTVGLLIMVYFFATFCFATFESTFSRLIHRERADAEHFIGYLFTYCGVLSAVLQGGLIGRLVKRFGEARIVAFSLVMFAAGLCMLPFLLSSWAWLILGLGLVAAGSGLNRPPTFGLISIQTPPDQQGATLGVAQSAGSLARIIAPVAGNLLFRYSPALPYLLCAVIALGAGLVAWRRLCHSPKPQA